MPWGENKLLYKLAEEVYYHNSQRPRCLDCVDNAFSNVGAIHVLSLVTYPL